MNNIEVGIGGDLTGLRGRINGRSYEGDFYTQLEHLKELLHSYDSEAKIDFIENRPPQKDAEKFGEVCLGFGLPVKQFSFSCHIGQPNAPCPLSILRDNLELARRTGTVDRLNIQIWGDNGSPDIEELVGFYDSAEELAVASKVELFTETHVNCFTYDPRRLIAVHEALTRRLGQGLRVNADLSHYVHQNGNTHYPNWEAVSSGELNINPLSPENFVSRHIIGAGLVGYGHLRCAVPNNLPPGEGSIQYPVVDPRHDPESDAVNNGGAGDVWNEERLKPWFSWYREIFRYQVNHPNRPVARFSTEFIGDGILGHYRVGTYRNLFQNIAMVSTIRKVIGEIQAEEKCGSGGH